MYSAYILQFLFSYVRFCYIYVTFPYCSMILGICLVCIQSIQPWTRSFEVAQPGIPMTFYLMNCLWLIFIWEAFRVLVYAGLSSSEQRVTLNGQEITDRFLSSILFSSHTFTSWCNKSLALSRQRDKITCSHGNRWDQRSTWQTKVPPHWLNSLSSV